MVTLIGVKTLKYSVMMMMMIFNLCSAISIDHWPIALYNDLSESFVLNSSPN